MQRDPDWKCDLSKKDLVALAKASLIEISDWESYTGQTWKFGGRYECKHDINITSGATVPIVILSVIGVGSIRFNLSDGLDVKKYFNSLIGKERVIEKEIIETVVLSSGIVVENRKSKDLNIKNFWCLKGHEQNIFHYEGGPAVDYYDGTSYYYTFGKQHRLDGPAVIVPEGKNRYFIAGNKIDGVEKYYWHPDVINYMSRMQNNTPSLVANEVIKKTENKTEQKNIKGDIMSDNSFVDMVKQDAVDGAYRASANQINKVVKATIISQLGKNTTSEGLTTISNLLDTEMGGALISMLIGLGITYTPKISEDPRALKLAKEFRVNGMSTGMNQVIEMIVPAFTDVMNKLPSVDVSLKAPNKHVLSKEEDKGNEKYEEEEKEEEEEEENSELEEKRNA